MCGIVSTVYKCRGVYKGGAGCAGGYKSNSRLAGHTRERESRAGGALRRSVLWMLLASASDERGANPFKSTQLRQWGFICYLEGHIVTLTRP